MLKILPISALAMLLTSCATGNFDQRELCPPLVNYTPTEQIEAADHLSALPQDHIIARMMDDYSALRDDVRVCGD